MVVLLFFGEIAVQFQQRITSKEQSYLTLEFGKKEGQK
jgi:hypothetical protein